MQEQALKVCEMCEEKEILILPNWIRRKANLRADKLSRSFDIVYQQISHIVFRRKMGCVQFRPVCVTVQRKVLQFKSNDWCQTQVELNAFCQRWTFGTNWWVPPSKNCVGWWINWCQREITAHSLFQCGNWLIRAENYTGIRTKLAFRCNQIIFFFQANFSIEGKKLPHS